MLPNAQSKYQLLDDSQLIESEVYNPELSEVSNTEIQNMLDSYLSEDIQEYDDRNFPGHSQPASQQASLKFAPAGMVGLMSKSEDVSLNTLFELARDLNDIYTRPMKAVFGAADGIMEAVEKPARTNASTVARAVSALMLPIDVPIKSAQGFIEGLRGHRGAAEILHRLGVKNAKEKLSPEDYARKEKEYEEKLKKQGIIGKVASFVAHEVTDDPLGVISGLIEDPVLVASAATGAAKVGARAVLKGLGEDAVLESIKHGMNVGKFLKSKLTKEEFVEFTAIISKSREKGGGGVNGLIEQLRNASIPLQKKIKELGKKMHPFQDEVLSPVTKINIGEELVTEEQIKDFLIKSLPNEVVHGSKENIVKLIKGKNYSAALAEAILTRQSKTARAMIEDPVERALSEFGLHAADRKLGEISYDAQRILWNELKKYHNLSENAFNELTLKKTLKLLPQNIGRSQRPGMELAILKSDPKAQEILSKEFSKVTPDDIEWVYDQYAKIIPKERLAEVFNRANIKLLGANQGALYNPKGLGALNFYDEVLRAGGLYEDFGHPQFIANLLFDKDKELYLEKFREALLPINGGNKFLGISPKKLEQLGSALEKKAVYAKLTTQERDFIDKRMRPLMDHLYKRLAKAIKEENKIRIAKGLDPLRELGYIKDYLPHIMETLEKCGLWEPGGYYDGIAPSIDTARRLIREGKLASYPTNIVDVYHTYLNGVLRFIHKRPVAQALTEKLGTMNLNPAMKDYITAHLKNFVGQKIEDPVIDTLVKGFMQTPLASFMGVTEETAREFVFTKAYNLLQFGYASGMGLNFKLPVRNMFQSLLGIPNTNLRTWTTAVKDIGKLMAPAVKHDAETKALNTILQNSKIYQGRVGDLSQMLPTEVSRNAAFPGKFETLLRKSIEITGFPQSEKWLFSQSMANGLRYRMEQLGISSYEALLKHPELANVTKYAENLAGRIHFHYNKMFRPLFLNNPSGAHILQYFTFGGRMANQALKDIMLPSRHKVLLKMLMQQSLLAMSLTAGGLAGAGYAAYFSALDPLKQLLQVGGPDTAKSLKSPALKGIYGAMQATVGGISGSKRLQSRGYTQMKQAVTPAVYKITKEAMDFKDPSRLFLYKRYPERKKK